MSDEPLGEGGIAAGQLPSDRRADELELAGLDLPVIAAAWVGAVLAELGEDVAEADEEGGDLIGPDRDAGALGLELSRPIVCGEQRVLERGPGAVARRRRWAERFGAQERRRQGLHQRPRRRSIRSAGVPSRIRRPRLGRRGSAGGGGTGGSAGGGGGSGGAPAAGALPRFCLRLASIRARFSGSVVRQAAWGSGGLRGKGRLLRSTLRPAESTSRSSPARAIGTSSRRRPRSGEVRERRTLRRGGGPRRPAGAAPRRRGSPRASARRRAG